MICVQPVLNLADMPKKIDQAEKTEQLNLRIRVSVIAELREFVSRQPFRPSVSSVVEEAVVQFMKQSPPPKSKGRSQ